MSEKKKSNKYMFTFLLDHASPESFYGMVDKGAAPHVKRYILGQKNPETGTYSNATICKNTITGFPSTSANTHTSILTGSYGGKNDLVLGNYWKLSGKKPQFIETSKIGLFSISKFNKEYVNLATKTLFEYIPNSASYHALNRGAKYKEFTVKSLMFTYLPLLIKMKKKDEPGRVSPIARPELWKDLFKKNMKKFLARAQEGELPDLTYFVFLLTDENGHRYGFGSPEYEEAVQILDLYVAGLIDGLDINGTHYPGLKEMGYLDSVVWNIHTDHAGRVINRDKYVFINRVLEVENGLTLIEGYDDDDAIKRSKRFWKKERERINAFSTVHSEIWCGWFGNPDNDLSSYRAFPGEDYFRNLTPLNPEINLEGTVDLITYLKKQDYIQFILIPEEDKFPSEFFDKEPLKRVKTNIPREYNIKIFNKNGNSIVTRKLDDNDAINYKYSIQDGEDPLNYKDSGLDYDKYYSSFTWLEKTYSLELPDVFHRLFGLFDSIHSPNIILTSERDFHFANQYENLGKKLLKIQSHDGLYRCESAVPLTFAGPGVNKDNIIPFARNIDVLPTLLELMDREYDATIMDGNAIKEVFE